MLAKSAVIPLFVALLIAAAQIAGALPRFFSTRLEGTIDTYPVVMYLTRLGDRLVGSYSYSRTGRPIELSADAPITDTGAFVLCELGPAPAEEFTGTFEGRFYTEEQVTGTWISPDGSKKLPFSVEAQYPSGSTRMEVIQDSRSFTEAGGATADLLIAIPQRAAGGGSDPMAADVALAYRGAYADRLGIPVVAGLGAMAGNFQARFVAAAAESRSGSGPRPTWADSFEPHIIFDGNGIVSIAASLMFSEGGAYPNTVDVFRSYAAQSGAPLALQDVLLPGYRDRLNALGRIAVKKAYHVASADDLSTAGLLVDDESFEMPSRFAITRGGLLFRFSEGEIGPHALGAVDIFVSYREIAPLIRKDGVLGPTLGTGSLLE